jgi:hypothetical protein
VFLLPLILALFKVGFPLIGFSLFGWHRGHIFASFPL